MGVATLKFVGPAVGLSNIDVGYVIDGSDDYDDALASMMAEAPPMLGSFVPVDFRLEPLDGSDSLWDGTLTYGPRTTNSPNGQNDPTYQFEIGVEKTKVLTSLQTMGKYGTRPPDFKRSINVQDDGTVEGVEISFPVFSWTETHYLHPDTVNRAYFRTIGDLVAKMNIAAFRDFQPGEVLLLGCNGSKRYSVNDWEMQFKFIGSPNATNLAIGPDITVTSKLGHDYLWATYTEFFDTDAKVMTRIPKNVFVERVYQMDDLNRLKLIDPLSL